MTTEVAFEGFGLGGQYQLEPAWPEMTNDEFTRLKESVYDVTPLPGVAL